MCVISSSLISICVHVFIVFHLYTLRNYPKDTFQMVFVDFKIDQMILTFFWGLEVFIEPLIVACSVNKGPQGGAAAQLFTTAETKHSIGLLISCIISHELF